MSGSQRVLVVDEERESRDALQQLLERDGFACVGAGSGAEALKCLEDPQLGCVLLDVRLSNPAALVLQQQLRERFPGVRVIALAGAEDQDLVLESLRLGASDYLAKPLHEEELGLALRRALSDQALVSRLERTRLRVEGLAECIDALEQAAREGASRDACANQAVQGLARVLGASRVSLVRVSDDRTRLSVWAKEGFDEIPGEELSHGTLTDSVSGLVLREGRPLLISDIDDDPRCQGRPRRSHYESASVILAPLFEPTGAWAVLCVTDRPGGSPFASEDLALLRLFARQLERSLAAPGAFAESKPVAPVVEPEPVIVPEPEPVPEPVVLSEPAPVAERAVVPEPVVVAPEATLEDGSDIELEISGDDEAYLEMLRDVCEGMTREIEPERLLTASLRPIHKLAAARSSALYLIDNQSGRLHREAGCEGHDADHAELPRDRGLTGGCLQSGKIVATDRPERDERFDPEIDTPESGATGPLLVVPLRVRDRVLGLVRIFPAPEVGADARLAELLGAPLSAATRNVLLYRSLLDSVEDVARARREAGARQRA